MGQIESALEGHIAYIFVVVHTTVDLDAHVLEVVSRVVAFDLPFEDLVQCSNFSPCLPVWLVLHARYELGNPGPDLSIEAFRGCRYPHRCFFFDNQKLVLDTKLLL